MPDHDTSGPDLLADQLERARLQRRHLPAWTASHPQFGPAAGYAVAAALAARRRAAGERPVGRKIGMTNRALWPAQQTAAPIWGQVWDSTLVQAPSGQATVDLAQATAPRIEPELGFRLKTAIDPARLSVRDLLACLDWVAPCFEVIDSHFGWKMLAADAIADFGVHYRLVVGTPLAITPERIAALEPALAACEATLSLDGTAVERGRGANTLGHPVQALAALVELLAAQGEPPLAAGEIITTGTLTAPREIAAGQRWTFRVTGLELAPLEVAFA